MMLVLMLMTGCGEGARGAGGLQDALDRIVSNDETVPGAALVARGPDLDFAGVAGFRSLESDAAPMEVDDPFRAASVTKTFVAAALLRRQEVGALSLDDTLDARLSDESLAALESGGYRPERITLRQLLGHTAGIYDYTEAEAYYAAILDDPSHRWTRAEQLQVAVDEGAPLHEPGAAYAYGDTHYILAGEALERSTGAGLAESLRETLDFAGLGLEGTWLESLEDAPAEDALERLGHPYIGEQDTRDWDPSWDLYGGGGLDSTAADLAVFIDALFSGEVYAEDGTLDEMLDVPAVAEGAFYGIDGALGINRFRAGGEDCWAGYGYFGTEVVRCPALDLTWAATLNQAEPSSTDAITNAVLDAAL
jgi:D-alanyl-D-alanine carboxypeptidase